MGSHVAGRLHVSNEVIADMVGHAALECYGVVGMVPADQAEGIQKILPESRLRRGIAVESTEEGVHVDLSVVIEYGTNINAVSQNLVDRISFVLREYARVPLQGVDVHVKDVRVRK